MVQTLLEGDVVEQLKQFPDNHFDGLLSDPPYFINFMGAKWDGVTNPFEFHHAWATEAIRVLKPGGYALVFGATRTYDQMAYAVRKAGFEIRDCIPWVYGSGMPHSADTSKAIDKKKGAKRKVVGKRKLTGNAAVPLKEKGGTYGIAVGTVPAKETDITVPATELAKKWNGYGTALKPASELVLVARKPFKGGIPKNIEKWGTGPLNIDGCRIKADLSEFVSGTGKPRSGMGHAHGYGMGEGFGGENANPPHPAGRWPANFIVSHRMGCQIVGTDVVKTPVINRFVDGAKPFGGGAGHEYETVGGGEEEIPVWECTADCPVRLLDIQSGDCPSTLAGKADPNVRHENPGDNGGQSWFGGGNSAVYADTGTASRFFLQIDDAMPFFYCKKANRKERDAGCESLPLRTPGETVNRKEGSAGINHPSAGAGRTSGARNHHQCVKPLSLTKYLATLIKPPTEGCRLLVPFAGSGSEMIGALQAGWSEVVGIEREAEYIEIAKLRLAHWVHQ